MKKLYLIVPLLLTYTFASAQFEDDILRFSRISPYGTARSAAMAGAFGALGGDLSTLSTNPAGIGVFRKSEVSFTPLLNFNSIESGNRSASKNSFQIGTLGGVFSMYNPNFDWRGFNVGFNYTNMNNFNRKLSQEVVESPSSLMDIYALSSNGYAPEDLDPFFTGLAYQAYLTNMVDTINYLYEPVLHPGELVNQYKNIKEDGYQGEFDISFGTNYKDKLYLGMTIGIQSIYYKMKSVYTEYAALDAPSHLDFYDLGEYSKLNGVGVNMKFGVIYRPIPELRLGAAIHTPTWFNMNYTFETSVYSQFTTPDDPATGRKYEYYDYLSPYILKRDFNMKTPWRAILSVATVLNQKAIISVDYEYIDYASAKYSGANDNWSYSSTNDNIKQLYHGGHNVRIGAEYRLNSEFSFRGGYSYQNTPYKHKGYDFVNSIPGGNKTQVISAGFGLNFGQVYCDAAYLYKFSKATTIFYSYLDPEDPNYDIIADPIDNTFKNHEARITVGYRF